MPKSYELKPNRLVFIKYRFTISFIIWMVLFLVLYFVIIRFIQIPWHIFLAVFVISRIFTYILLRIKYQKEKYIFHADKIIRRQGSIFSDKETELVIKNITHVSLKLPFIENKLFKTGHIYIESAGTAKTEVRFFSVSHPEYVHNYIQELMKHNGFKLTKSNLIQKERPHPLGVFFETFKNFLVSFGIVAWFIFYLIQKTKMDWSSIAQTYSEALVIVVVIISIILLTKALLVFLDLRRRVYNIYSDTITYSEGFLTKNYSFIPIENLADATVTQTIIDRIFGLYDVKVSCQGSAQEVLFKNIMNAQKLEKNIDHLISKYEPLIGSEKNIKHEKKEAKLETPYASKLHGDTSFKAEYRMDPRRTMNPLFIALPFSLLFPPLFLILIFTIISTYIKMKNTAYFIKEKGMEERFIFATSKTKEFSNDKITAVIFKESFIDRWFNTCSVVFWSIGSSEEIKFQNLKKTKELYEGIVSKIGIKPQETLFKMNSKFSLIEKFKGNLYITIMFVLVFIASIFLTFLATGYFIVVTMILIILYTSVLLYERAYYKKSKMTFFKDYVFFERGLLFKDYFYVLYDDIKDIVTVKYPLSKVGSVTFNIAGECIIKDQKNKNTQVISNKFMIPYIENIENKDELIDIIFYKRPNAQQVVHIDGNIGHYSQKPVLMAKQATQNSVLVLIIISVVIFPLLALLPIFLPLMVWSIKVKRFIIEPHRVVAKSGIIFKRQASIVFNKIDHINTKQGPFNKMFKNGTVTINTVGSSMPEMVVGDIPKYKEFYELLKKYY